MSLFFNQSLEGILSSFDRLASKLDTHLSRKTAEQLELLDLRADIDEEIVVVSKEVDRAHRVLVKVQELVA